MPTYFKQKPTIRRYFIEEGLTAHALSKRYRGRPSTQTVINWSKVIDEHGKTWIDYRREFAEDLYLAQASSSSVMAKCLIQIHKQLAKPELDSKAGNTLIMLRKTFETFADPKYHTQTLFAFLEDFLHFTKQHNPDLLTDAFVANARDFKNHIRDRVNLGLPENP